MYVYSTYVYMYIGRHAWAYMCIHMYIHTCYRHTYITVYIQDVNRQT